MGTRKRESKQPSEVVPASQVATIGGELVPATQPAKVKSTSMTATMLRRARQGKKPPPKWKSVLTTTASAQHGRPAQLDTGTALEIMMMAVFISWKGMTTTMRWSDFFRAGENKQGATASHSCTS